MKQPRCLSAILALSLFIPSAPATAGGYFRALGGYGSGDFYGPGFGFAAGAELPFSTGRTFIVGFRGLYHTGTSDSDLSDVTAGNLIGGVSQSQALVEFGTVWLRKPLMVATVGTLGIAHMSFDVAGVNLDSENKFLVGPGLLIAKPFGETGFLGIEFKYSKISDFDSSFGVFATFGGAWGL